MTQVTKKTFSIKTGDNQRILNISADIERRDVSLEIETSCLKSYVNLNFVADYDEMQDIVNGLQQAIDYIKANLNYEPNYN